MHLRGHYLNQNEIKILSALNVNINKKPKLEQICRIYHGKKYKTAEH